MGKKNRREIGNEKKNKKEVEEIIREPKPRNNDAQRISPNIYGSYGGQPEFYDNRPPIHNYPYSYAHAYPQMFPYNTPNMYHPPMDRDFSGMTYPNNTLDDVDDESDTEERVKGSGSGKKKLSMEYIEQKSRRSVTFSKRKKGIMKKAFELNLLTGSQILLLVASESGHVYTFATPKLKPMITEHEHLIQKYLNTAEQEEHSDYYSENDRNNGVTQKYREDDFQGHDGSSFNGYPREQR